MHHSIANEHGNGRCAANLRPCAASAHQLDSSISVSLPILSCSSTVEDVFALCCFLCFRCLLRFPSQFHTARIAISSPHKGKKIRRTWAMEMMRFIDAWQRWLGGWATQSHGPRAMCGDGLRVVGSCEPQSLATTSLARWIKMACGERIGRCQMARNVRKQHELISTKTDVTVTSYPTGSCFWKTAWETACIGHISDPWVFHVP